MTKHRVHISRFVRGMTRIRPQRALYGHQLKCVACGWQHRTNENRRVAEQLAKQHEREGQSA